MSQDIEAFLISWAQLKNILLMSPEEHDYRQAMDEVEQRLQCDFGIADLQLVARSFDAYTIAYMENNERHLFTVPAEEIDDFG